MRKVKYFRFCVNHVKAYNKSYNYFDGMADDDIGAWIKASQKLAIARPGNWVTARGRKTNARAPPRPLRVNTARSGNRNDGDVNDPHSIFEEAVGTKRAATSRRRVGNAERKALDTLGLDPGVTADEIKAQYKLLVKRFHPDANGGSRETEDRLRDIITAYNVSRAMRVCAELQQSCPLLGLHYSD